MYNSLAEIKRNCNIVLFEVNNVVEFIKLTDKYITPGHSYKKIQNGSEDESFSIVTNGEYYFITSRGKYSLYKVK